MKIESIDSKQESGLLVVEAVVSADFSQAFDEAVEGKSDEETLEIAADLDYASPNESQLLSELYKAIKANPTLEFEGLDLEMSMLNVNHDPKTVEEARKASQKISFEIVIKVPVRLSVEAVIDLETKLSAKVMQHLKDEGAK